MTTALIIVCVLLGLTLLAAGWVLWQWQQCRQEAVTLRVQLESATQQHRLLSDERAQREHKAEQVEQKLRQEVADHLATAGTLREQLAKIASQRDEMLKQFDAAQQQARQHFGEIAQGVLGKANEAFLQLAEQKLAGQHKDANAQLEQRKQAIEALVKPIAEQLDKTKQTLGEIEKSRENAYGSLRQQLTSMVDDQRRLRDETANLVKALRRPEVRGRWGEMQLRRVAELAGMSMHCDFVEQSTLDGDAGRPDMLVKLPGGREIVIDAKTPIDAFVAAVECVDDGEREQQLDRHVRHISDKVLELSSKRYQDALSGAADFVVLFIPGESFLYAAAQRRPDLMEQAMNRGVVIATPTTLIGLLKVVAMGWREEQIAENARRIAELGQELHKRIATAIEHVNKLGKSLETATGHYNNMVGSLERQVLPQARRFKELGADSPKELPAEGEVFVVESQPREMRAVEAGE